ncbi:MAG: shikimate kinase [Archaeoglobaceae archaeon]
MRGEAYAAGTIVNGLATGIGCAFGLDLKTRVDISIEDDIKYSILLVDGKEVSDRIVDRVMRSFGFKGIVKAESVIPRGCGLGSSSAFMNAMLISILNLKEEELDAQYILTTNATMAMEMGISYTGAIDDAGASLLGGVVLSNNEEMKFYHRNTLVFDDALILIPEWGRGEISMKELRKEPQEVEHAVDYVFEHDYMSAMLSNSRYYCRKLEYSFEPVEQAAELGLHGGLSGNGPAYTAFGERDRIQELKTLWDSYGQVIETKLVNSPCDDIKNIDHLFTT